MNRRGRPPYPDILTPREWQVLDLLRGGLSNDQIGERLGISRDGVKYHVSEILSKLGVDSRQDAARWHPETTRRARNLVLLGGIFKSIGSPALKTLLVGALVVGVIALALLLHGVLTTARVKDEAATTLEVAWAEAQLPLLREDEAARPFLDSIEGREDLWQAYVVDGSSAPALLFETRRMLDTAPVWSEDKRRITFAFGSRLPDLKLIRGYMTHTLGQPGVDRDTTLEPSSNPRLNGDGLLLGHGIDMTITVASLQSSGGGGQRLTGLGDRLYPGEWSPDGTRFVFLSLSPARTNSATCNLLRGRPK